MTEQEPQSLPGETVRLSFEPSDSLRDALGNFYNQANQHKASDLRLQSMEYFRLSILPGGAVRPYPNHEEMNDRPSIASRMSVYNAQSLKPIENHQMSMASYMVAANTSRHSLKLFMRILPSYDDMYNLSRLEDFDIRPTHTSIDVYTEIYPMQRVVGEAGLHAAGINLHKTLRVGEHRGSKYSSERSPADARTLFVRQPQLQRRSELFVIDPLQQESQPQPKKYL